MSLIVKSDSILKLIESFKKLDDKYEVYSSVKNDKTDIYKRVKDIEDSEIESSINIIKNNEPPISSIKSFVFSSTEEYLKFKREKSEVEFSEIDLNLNTKIILGAKACDIESISILDRVFLKEPIDTLYQKKRESVVLVASVCSKSGANCFCDRFGVDRLNSAGADILLIDGNQLENESSDVFLKSKTKSGENLINELLEIDEVEKVDEISSIKSDETIKAQISPEEIKDKMEELYNSDIWKDLAMSCLGCGICTYYCPTCHCYDINDYYRKNEGVRYRSWDSCMFSNFTNMAGGHNPRPSREDRVRNRFFHKLNYFVKKEGPLACVGCGRCQKYCPAGISINDIVNRIGGAENV